MKVLPSILLGYERLIVISYLVSCITTLTNRKIRFGSNGAKGDMAIWDNRCTQHYAVADYLPAEREMNRITVINDARVS